MVRNDRPGKPATLRSSSSFDIFAEVVEVVVVVVVALVEEEEEELLTEVNTLLLFLLLFPAPIRDALPDAVTDDNEVLALSAIVR